MKLVRNPYLNRSMIRNPEAFFGRRREIARLAQRIASIPPQSVAVVGDRRIGKSSLLSHISDPKMTADYLEEPERTLFLFLDFQEERRLSIEGFFRAVFRRLQENLGDRCPALREPDYEGMQSAVEQVEQRGYRLILMLDEFDRVTRSSSFDADFFAFLRSLAGHHDIAYLTSSGRDLQQLCHTEEIADSPFFNIFSTLHLGPFLPEEALDLIRLPSAVTPFPLEQHREPILELGGLFPFFLQMACSAAFELLLETGACSPAQLCERFLEEAQPHFQFYWEQMDAVERSVCNDLTQGRDADATRKEYQDLARRGFILPEGCLFSRPFAGFVAETYAREVGEEPVEVQAQRLRSMTEELEKARQVQEGLLPKEPPQLAGLEVAGRCVPARQVGGDFYAYLWGGAADSRLGIVAVDVRGHGMEGAVIALRFSETLRYEARNRTRPAEIMAGLNRALHGTLQPREYVCCCIGIVEMSQRRLVVASGGYHPPLCYSRRLNQVQEFALGDLPLGVRPDTAYQSVECPLEAGDVLLFYSDGVIEAQDDREGEYGEDRLRELLAQAGRERLGAEALIERLFWDVGRFSASVGQQDDITAIAVRVVT